MKSKNVGLLLAALAAQTPEGILALAEKCLPKDRTTGSSLKNCLNCGTHHAHHNSFCSRECCMAHKKKSKTPS